MLESERESQKKWSPVGKMNYRGGIYVGRCQGGLPEGKVLTGAHIVLRGAKPFVIMYGSAYELCFTGSFVTR